jgi:glutathione S-transferase
MNQDRHVTLYHWPQSRAAGVRILLEELGADYDVQVMNLQTGVQRQADYLAINPMGKVPAIRHGEVLVTEQAAIYMYLAELYPEAGLSPAVGDPLRGPYLRWMVFYGSCFEPALIDRALKRDAPPIAMSPYGNADMVMKTVTDQLAKGPYILGERFTAADVLWAAALNWATMFKLAPEDAVIPAYIERILSRTACALAKTKDDALMAAHAEPRPE